MIYPHETGFSWPISAIKVRVEAGVYQSLVLEAMDAWNTVISQYSVYLQSVGKTRKQITPKIGDRESTIYLTTDTSFYADCDHRYRSSFITEADIRINPTRFATLPPARAKLILIHELGHLLGWNHHDGPDLSVLHTKLPPSITGITEFDKKAAASLYGKAQKRASILKQIAQARRITNPRQRSRKIADLQKQLVWIT